MADGRIVFCAFAGWPQGAVALRGFHHLSPSFVFAGSRPTWLGEPHVFFRPAGTLRVDTRTAADLSAGCHSFVNFAIRPKVVRLRPMSHASRTQFHTLRGRVEKLPGGCVPAIIAFVYQARAQIAPHQCDVGAADPGLALFETWVPSPQLPLASTAPDSEQPQSCQRRCDHSRSCRQRQSCHHSVSQAR